MNVCSKCNTVIETYEGIHTHVCGEQPLKGSCIQPTDNQQLKAETLRCTECEHTYDESSPTPVTWSRYCYSCLWFPKKPVLTDNFIQRKASAI